MPVGRLIGARVRVRLGEELAAGIVGREEGGRSVKDRGGGGRRVEDDMVLDVEAGDGRGEGRVGFCSESFCCTARRRLMPPSNL